MSEPFIGQIEAFAFGIVPKGWAICQGQILAISTNQALYALLGNRYGGNGTTTFGLPDLRGRIPISFSSNHPQGSFGGEEQHTLLTTEIPAHTHQLFADATTTTGLGPIPSPSVAMGQSNGTGKGGDFPVSMYGAGDAINGTLDPRSLTTVGGAPHENRKPYLAIQFCIALVGIFPSRN